MGPPADPRGLLRPFLRSFEPYEPALSPEEVAELLGLPPERVVKLDANENPYGPSPRVRDALAGGRFHLYPDPLQRRLRRALADYAGVEPEWVVVGAGADELIDLAVRLFVEPGQKVVDLPPTFGMYRVVARAHGARVVEVERDGDFAVDPEAVERALDRDTRLIFLTNPNTPTGDLTPLPVVRRLLETGRVVVVDETYHEFSGFTVLPLLEEYPNLVVLRSLSKWAGLAGLRIGYALLHPDLARTLLAVKLPYNLSVAGEVSALASLEDRDTLLARVKALVRERERMREGLERLPGACPRPSHANFLLCRFPGRSGERVRDRLRERGVLVRFYRHPRLLDAVRISVGLPQHTDALLSALREVLETEERE